MGGRVRFLRCSLENFMPFRERVEFPMADVGLVVVRGDNRVSAAANDNGAGKSSLVVDGPAWVLFGETLRGLKGTDVVCRSSNAKRAAVGELVVSTGDGDVLVRRTARPSGLNLVNIATGETMYPDLSIKDLQAHVDAMLGFGLRTYRNAVVFGQGAFDRFAQADQAEQLRMLDEIQGMDLRGARDRAKAWRDAAQASLDGIGEDEREADRAVRSAAERVQTLEASRAPHEADRARRVADSERAIAAAQERERLAAAAVEESGRARDALPAARMRAAHVAERTEALRVVERADLAVGQAEARVASSVDAERRFRAAQASRADAALRRIGEAEKTAAAANERLESARSAAASVPSAREYVAVQKALRVAVDAALATARDAERERAVRAREHEAALRALDDMLGKSACPTCRTKFSAAVAEKVRRAFEPDLVAAATALDRASDAMRDANAALDAARDAVAVTPQWTPETLAVLESEAVQVARLERDALQSVSAAAQARRDLAAVEAETYDGSGLSAQAQIDLAAARSTAETARETLRGVDARVLVLPTLDGPAIDLPRLEALGSEVALQRAQGALGDARRAVAAAEAARDAARSEPWGGTALLDQARADLDAARSALDDYAPRRVRAEATLRVAEYWLEAFGDRGIRSLMFDSVAGFLNDRLAHHLSLLAAGEAVVTVSALSALKGGGTREKISVGTDWSWGGAGRGTGSAGQDRRVDLALFASLQDLAESRSARPFPVKVWDEPGDALDARGQEMFARWVEREAGQRGAGFLITHSQALAESVRASQVWTVRMDRDGARLEMRGGGSA